jgi:Spy/CpxP family protein refolding chaperone
MLPPLKIQPTMKSTRKYILAVCALALGFTVPSIRAQEAPEAPKKEHGPRGNDVQVMKEKLGLTDAQVEQIKQIREDARAQMEKLKKDESLSKEDKMAAMKKIREATKAKVDAVLTPEQLEKAKALHRDGPGGPGGEKGPKDGKDGKKKPGTEE